MEKMDTFVDRFSPKEKSTIVEALSNKKLRDNLYEEIFLEHITSTNVTTNKGNEKIRKIVRVFTNPCYTKDHMGDDSNNIRDFLRSVPSFADFTDHQFVALERKATLMTFRTGHVIFRQGDPGDSFYVIHKGSVNIIVDGKVVNRMSEGSFFGERALMTSEPRAATVSVQEDGTACLVFSRDIYTEIISGSSALIGGKFDDHIDWSKDHETRSLYRHVDSILAINTTHEFSPNVQRAVYELATAFTPELSVDDIIARIVITVKNEVKSDRVGLFLLSEDKKSMILKVSEKSRGMSLPLRGLAGAVITTQEKMNITDAYNDHRFDPTMDKITGYRTKQVLGVPLCHPITRETIGMLQCCNRTDSTDKPFTEEHVNILDIAAEQLSELILGREEIFAKHGEILQSDNSSSNRNSATCSIPPTSHTFSSSSLSPLGNDHSIELNEMSASHVNSSDIINRFSADVSSLSLGPDTASLIAKSGCNMLEINVALYLSVNQLCIPKSIMVSLPKHLDGRGKGEIIPINVAPSESRIIFDLAVRDLPRAARVMIRLIGRRATGSGVLMSSASSGPSSIALGWVAANVFDFKGYAEQILDLRFFQGEMSVPITTTLSNSRDNTATSVSITLGADFNIPTARASPSPSTTSSMYGQITAYRIFHTMPKRSIPLKVGVSSLTEEETIETNRIALVALNPLSMSLLTSKDKQLMWELRLSILDRPDLLPPFIMCIDWSNSDCVRELYDLLDLWKLPSPVQALQLLDRRFMDPKVRAYACHCLEELKDDELRLYMLQLCQQLKFESYVDSALSRFLLRRALMNPTVIGHIFFWHLQSELYNQDVNRRFSTLLQVYISKATKHRIALGHQMFVMKRLEKVAEIVAGGESKSSRLEILREQLEKISFPPSYHLPLNPQLQIKGIDINRCKVMESKKKPLWLNLKDAVSQQNPGSITGNDIVLMLKVGDDLRQDALIIQLLRVMDVIWKKEGLDMKMMLYDCVSTGNERGLLQVVQNSSTLASIILDKTDHEAIKNSVGGSAPAEHLERLKKMRQGSISRKVGSAMRALTDFSHLKEWIWTQVCIDLPNVLEENNEFERKNELERRINNFVISCAAYCVASYVLGLGDRHNDNLMMTREGHFFHIDFGHILGNFKSKLGIKRERAPFIFTPAMKEVIDEKYDDFATLCCDCYNILRENASLIVSLVSLAIPCNLPELREEKDVLWIYDKLLLGVTDEEAAMHFKEELETSLRTVGTRVNDSFHMLAHA